MWMTHGKPFSWFLKYKTFKRRVKEKLFSSLFGLDSAALFILNEQQFYLFGQIQTSQTGGQPYIDTSPYGECSIGTD